MRLSILAFCIITWIRIAFDVVGITLKRYTNRLPRHLVDLVVVVVLKPAHTNAASSVHLWIWTLLQR